MMKVTKKSHAFVIASLILSLAAVKGKNCGFPGKPNNGSVISEQKFFYPGEEVTFECEPGFILFGSNRRVCSEGGTWSGTLPECRYNLALKRITSQSETLWSYESGLAVDGDPNSCSFTPQSDVQRWWQVHLRGSPRVGSVAITMSPGSYQHFSIFVVELMDGNKAMYKPCSKFEGRFQDQKSVFQCNDNEGHTGQFVYIRDDREDKEYFGLCEVEVFEHEGHPKCGQPEQPLYGQVKTSGEFAHYTCNSGYTLTGNNTRQCTWKGWQGQVPECKEVQCDHPESTKDGFIEVSNFKGSYVYGSRATYHCNPGFILWGNATRICNALGVWTGTTPQCQPIACGDPVTFAHASVTLVNGTTVWRSLARYNCIKGYIPSKKFDRRENRTVVESVCLQNGTWTHVELSCIRDPNYTDSLGTTKHGLNDESAPGGFLVGPGGRIVSAREGWTMLTISVLVAIILGMAVAFFILFIRRWFTRCNDTSSNHHLIIAPGSNQHQTETGPETQQFLDESNDKYFGDGGGGAGAGSMMGYGNHYATLPAKNSPGRTYTSNPGYQTTTLSTFSMRGHPSARSYLAASASITAVDPPQLPPHHQRIVRGEMITPTDAVRDNIANHNVEEAELKNNTLRAKTEKRPSKSKKNAKKNSSYKKGAPDGLTTATSVSSSCSSISPTSSPRTSQPSTPTSSSGNNDEVAVKRRLLPPDSAPNNTLARDKLVSNRSVFKYADHSDLAGVNLRRGCLKPVALLNHCSGTSSLKRNSSPQVVFSGTAKSSKPFDPFDPIPDEEGRIVLLPSTESIPDILQTLSSQTNATRVVHEQTAMQCRSLTRAGQVPRDVMALYAKVDKRSNTLNNNNNNHQPGENRIIVNELSDILGPGVTRPSSRDTPVSAASKCYE